MGYIKKEFLINKFEDLKEKAETLRDKIYLDGVLSVIENAPTANVVEVVRCRGCMHCEIVIDQFDNDWYFCKKTKDNAEVKPDDFCSYGERKE